MRLSFTAGDLVESRFAVSALHHAVYAALCVHNPYLAPAGTVWGDIRRALPGGSLPLVDLLAAGGVTTVMWQDLMRIDAPALSTGRPSLGDELDAMTALGRRLEDPARRFTGRLWRLMRADSARDLLMDASQLLRVLADGLYVLFHRFLAPDWPAIRRRLEADIARRAETAFRDGMGSVLAALSPRLSWTGAGLQIAETRWPDAALGGHGLLSSPIVSAGRGFLSLCLSNDDRRSLMCYPVPSEVRPGSRGDIDTLAALVGAARARVLRAVEPGRSTGELARRLNISPSTVSEHVRTLREAGLVVTHRDGRAVRHVLSPLGWELLTSNG